jgi:hypothetical protein
MPIVTVSTPKLDLVNAFFVENSKYQTNLGSLGVLERIAQDPTESEERRAEALAKYERIKKEVEIGAKKLKKLQRDLDKLEGGKDLTKVQDEMKKLNEQKSLLIDPTGTEAVRIDEKIEELVKPFQKAYSKVAGVQISERVARTKLLGKKVPTFGAPAKEVTQQAKPKVVAEQVVETPVASVTGQTDKKPTPDKVTPSKPKVKQEVTTRNPVTGEVIKVSDIKPATGEAPEKVEVGPNALPPVDRTAAGLGIAEKYDLSEALFKNVDSLNKIYEQYVNPKSKMTDEEFIRRIQNDVWYKKNSKGIKQRFVQYYNYQDLVKTGQVDPAVPGTTQYEQDIESIVRSLEKRAVEIGSAAASNPTALRQAAENLYITNKEKDTTFVDDLLASSIRAVAGTIGGKTTEGYSGEALKNYNELVKAARSNGFQLADIIPGGASVDQVLQGVATGKIDVNRVIADARKMAAQGQPQYVRDLLAQGYNLDQVFKPYRTAMANVLEIGDPDQIDLNDPLLRSAITDKGDMNLYDFKKQLKADSRWQYTENARQEVSTAALSVLRDFGFQG